MKRLLRLPAIRVDQGSGRTLYTFAVDGKLIPRFATISRLKRSGSGVLEGYQRPEVLSHIEEIRNYVESEAPMVPNAVVLSFDSRVKFQLKEGPKAEYAKVGEILIPIDDAAADEDLPGFIVDGQQRVAAIRDAAVSSFPICVSAFITDDIREQTEQFILVNSTKPLPKGLIYELLPVTKATLPALLSRRRLPAYLLTRLNLDEVSPLRGLIQTPTNPGGVIKDNSILRMLENSLSDGLLYRIREGARRNDARPLLDPVVAYWSAVRHTFPTAWGLPPKRSRLMHGAGVVSLGLVMELIAERHRGVGTPSEKQFARDLAKLKDVCSWTSGYWNFGPGQQRKWNELQNTSKDIQLLSNYLRTHYQELVWNRARSGTRGLQP